MIIPLVLYSGILEKHAKLLAFAMLPIYLSFILLYNLILKENNWDFIHLKVIKIIFFTSVFQIVFTIPEKQMISTFRAYGLKENSLIIILGAFT